MILDARGRRCPVTGEELTEGRVVDRSPRQRRVRGILSRYANHRVVGRHEDGDLLIRAGEYLKDPPARRLFPKQEVPEMWRRRRKNAVK